MNIYNKYYPIHLNRIFWNTRSRKGSSLDAEYELWSRAAVETEVSSWKSAIEAMHTHHYVAGGTRQYMIGYCSLETYQLHCVRLHQLIADLPKFIEGDLRPSFLLKVVTGSAMTDLLSVTAGAAGLISLGIQVTQSLVNYYNSYKGPRFRHPWYDREA